MKNQFFLIPGKSAIKVNIFICHSYDAGKISTTEIPTGYPELENCK